MDSKTYLTIIYTTAFYLTGKEEKAIDLILLVIPQIAMQFNWQIAKPVMLNMFELSVKGVCQNYINEPNFISCTNNPSQNIIKKTQDQKSAILRTALMKLQPIERLTVVWRDVLGWNLFELAVLTGSTKGDLYNTLSQARRHLYDFMTELI